MPMEYNHSPISLREGVAYIDGVECLDCVNMTISFTPEVWTGRQLGEATPSSRWIGMSISGTMTRRRSNAFLKDIINKYREDKSTPEITIQGIMDDKNSDYYAENGNITVTAVGCVLTGDMTLLSLDSDGEILDDEIGFNVKDVL